MSRWSARRKASAGMRWLPFDQATWTKYSSRLNPKSPSLNVRYPCWLGSIEPISGTEVVAWLMVSAPSLSLGTRRGLADLGPALDGVGAGQGLEQHHTGLRRVELVGAADRQKRHVAAAGAHHAHLSAIRRAADRDGARSARRRRGLVELQEPDLHLAIHDERELILGWGAPAGRALRADRFDHVLDVLDDLDAALVVVLERPEACLVTHCSPPLARRPRPRRGRAAGRARPEHPARCGRACRFECEAFVDSARRLVKPGQKSGAAPRADLKSMSTGATSHAHG